MSILGKIFTWWDGATVGTLLNSWKTGVKVGEDGLGNTYHRARKGDRRWVIYNGTTEATRIPPGWHGWIHHRVDVPPVDENYAPRDWQKPHQPNLTGSPQAYRPPGAMVGQKLLQFLSCPGH